MESLRKKMMFFTTSKFSLEKAYGDLELEFNNLTNSHADLQETSKELKETNEDLIQLVDKFNVNKRAAGVGGISGFDDNKSSDAINHLSMIILSKVIHILNSLLHSQKNINLAMTIKNCLKRSLVKTF